jgi:hypothetical protein
VGDESQGNPKKDGNMRKVTFWKFVSHPVSTTEVHAAALAKRIESGEVAPMNQHGERFYKLGGWCYDIGRKPYLVQYAHGHIERHWALSVAELRRACYLSRNDKVVPDPFFKEQDCQFAQAA